MRGALLREKGDGGSSATSEKPQIPLLRFGMTSRKTGNDNG
jgi:hypothetical protein